MKKRLLPSAFVFDSPQGYLFLPDFKKLKHKQRKKIKRSLQVMASMRADYLREMRKKKCFRKMI